MGAPSVLVNSPDTLATLRAMLSTGQARVIARRRNVLHLVDAATGRPVVTRGGRPVGLPVQERLVAVWRAAGEAPCYFVCERTRPGWLFDPVFGGELEDVWKPGPIVQRYTLGELQETWGRGLGWSV